MTNVEILDTRLMARFRVWRESNARLELREESDVIDEEGVKAKPRFRA